MEKWMYLSGISGLISRQVNDRNGTPQVFENFNVTLTDGMDSVLAETSKNVTERMKVQAPAVGKLYNVNVKLRVVNYTKDGKEMQYFGATLMDYALIG